MRLVHSEATTNAIQYLDIKSYGELDVLSDTAVTTLLRGDEIDIRSGATVSDVMSESKMTHLPGGESNPGLPRDRRGYLPLYYRGCVDVKFTLFPYCR